MINVHAEHQALLHYASLLTATNMTTRATDLQPFTFFGRRIASTTQRRAAIIGFAGPKGCGKSTVAEALRAGLKDGYQAVARHRFAQPIKDMARALGLTAEQIDGAEKETPLDLLGGCTPRYVMQTLGTQWGRDMISADLWVNATMARINAEPEAIALIDDVRFANEANAIRARGGLIVELAREGAAYDSTHASEAGLPRELIDVTIDNADAPQVVALAALVFAACRRAEAVKDTNP